MNEEIMIVELRDSEWGRGLETDGKLLDQFDLKCCIGVYLSCTGVENERLRHLCFPSDLIRRDEDGNIQVDDNSIDGVPGWLLAKDRWNDGYIDSDATEMLATINDDPSIENDEVRVDKLNEVLERHNINVRFKYVE